MSNTQSAGRSAGELIAQLRALNPSSYVNDEERKSVVEEAKALVARLETPFEAGFRFGWVEPARMAALEIFIRLGFFKKWHAAGDATKHEDELADLVADECDPVLFSESCRSGRSGVNSS